MAFKTFKSFKSSDSRECNKEMTNQFKGTFKRVKPVIARNEAKTS